MPGPYDFTLSKLADGNNVYFDDISVVVDKTVSQEPYLELKYKNLIREVGNVTWLSYDTNVEDSVIFKSSNDSVAVVSEYGQLTAIAEGECYITITAGELSDTCHVTVFDNSSTPQYVFSLAEDSTYCYYSYTVGGLGHGAMAEFCYYDQDGGKIPSVVCTSYKAYDIYPTAEAARAAYDELTEGLTDDEIEEMGLTLDEEIVIRTDSAQIGRIKALVISDIKEEYLSYFPENPIVDEPYLTLNTTRLYMAVGDTSKLLLNTNSQEQILWSSDNDSVAVVDQNGLVVAIGQGYCLVTVTDGSLSETCAVTVESGYGGAEDAEYEFIVADDSLSASFYYIVEGEMSYEISAEFGESDSGVVCTSILYTITLSSAEEAQEAYENMTAELPEEFIESLNVDFNDEGTGFSYTNPEMIGMDRDAVLAMMYQSYNSWVNPVVYDEEALEGPQ